MYVNVCGICQKRLQDGLAYCERCNPFSEEYAKEVVRIWQENQAAGVKAIEKFRNTYFQTKVIPMTKQQSLKAV